MKYNSSDWYISSRQGGEPVTPNEIKKHLNLSFETSGSYDFTDDDDYLSFVVGMATSMVENYIGQSVRKNTITATIRNESGNISLPMCPYGTLVSVTDGDGNDLTDQLDLSPGIYPMIKSPVVDEILMVYSAGWYELGTNSYGKLPVEIKQAIIEEAAWRYVNRGTENAGLGSQQAKALLAPFIKKSWLA